MEKSLCNTCSGYPCALEQRHICEDCLFLLMHLHLEFESLQRQFLHCGPLPTLEAALKELMVEETRLCELGSLSIGHSTCFDIDYFRIFCNFFTPTFSLT